MHYLECIALLDYLRKKLQIEQRVPVPIGVLDEVKQQVLAVDNRVSKEGDPQINALLDDLKVSLFSVEVVPGTENIPDTVKTALADGVQRLLHFIAIKAYHHFEVNSFEPNNIINKSMRIVVEEALEEGVLVC